MSASITRDARAQCVVRQGYLRKLKTMKKKYFVLKSESWENSARLEYYDSENKFRRGTIPKRIIPLKTCFNINRRLDTRQKHVIALYTKEEMFCVVLDGEDDLRNWLSDLLKLYGVEGSDELEHPTQHVWQVNVHRKGLGASKNIIGLYNLCLTDQTIILFKIKTNNNIIEHSREKVEFSLRNIRRCGDSECFFYMEVGRQTVTGAGELWMHTDDANIAQSMHSTILHAMSNCTKDIDKDLAPTSRNRSSSATESSKPIALLSRRQTYTEAKRTGLSPSNDSATSIRNRCDSMPSRTCPRDMEVEKTPSRLPGDIGDGGSDSRDEIDSTDWHRTPRIPEEPDAAYCEMTPFSLLPSRLGGSVEHSRTSSFAEETSPPDGYLPMAPAMADAGYVDMQRAASPAASSGSVASGTPSTDLRFSEYHLDPATSRILTDDEPLPIPRAHSVGSSARPALPFLASHDTARTRAFSCGAHAKTRPFRAPLAPIVSKNKTSSAPSIAPRASAEDLMELDFSNNQAASPKTRPTMLARTPPSGFAMPPPRTPSFMSARRESKVDEYVDMSPTSSRVDGYMEMRPTEGGLAPYSSGLSMSRSPPGRLIAQSPPSDVVATTPDGYVEMNYGSKRTDSTYGARRIESSRPISINSGIPVHRFDMRFPSRTDSEISTPLTISPMTSPLTPSRPDYPDQKMNKKRSARKNSKDIGTPISSQTIFSMSLDSPISPAIDMDTSEAWDDDNVAFPEPSGLSTLREISEESGKKEEEPMDESEDYIRLNNRPTSKPIAAPAKADSSLEDMLPSNPTATKTLAIAITAVGDSNAPLVRAGGGGNAARFTLTEDTCRKSSSPKPDSDTVLNYASLDLEPRGTGATATPRAYAEVDFVRTHSSHTADSN